MTAQNDEKETDRQDWNQLAKQALDLWQTHLTALSKDEKAKADMAQMMKPMTQMASQWVDVMQNAYVGPRSEQTGAKSAEEKSSPKHEPKAEASAVKAEAPVQSAAPQEEAIKEAEKAEEVAEVATSVPDVKPAPVSMSYEEVSEKAQNDVKSDESTNELHADASNGPGGNESSVVATDVQPESAVKPAIEPQPEASSSGDTASAAGNGDMASITNRLAQLEQELESLRPRNKRPVGRDEESATGS